MRAKILAIILFSLLIASMKAQGDDQGPLCKKVHDDKDLLNAIANFAGCSNVNTNYTDVIQNWSYEYCVAAASKQQMAYINVITDGKEGTKGSLYLLAFTAYDTIRNLIIVSFRGSLCGDKWKNAKTDIDFFPPQNVFHYCDFCTMHRGFKSTYDFFKKPITKNINDIFDKVNSPTKPRVVITGISYGAAIAAIAAYDLKKSGADYEIISYTYGQPRIGNMHLINDMNKHTKIFRWVNEGDPVPHLPNRLSDYYNPGRELYLKGSSSLDICYGDGGLCSLRQTQLKHQFHMVYPKILYDSFDSSNCQEIGGQANKDEMTLTQKMQEVKNTQNWKEYQCKEYTQKKCQLKGNNSQVTEFSQFTSNPYITCKDSKSAFKDFMCLFFCKKWVKNQEFASIEQKGGDAEQQSSDSSNKNEEL